MGKKKSNKAKNKPALSPKAVNTPVQKEEVKAENAKTDMVADFINLNSRLFKYFGCDEEFFVKPLLDYNWTVKREDEFCFLAYWLEGEKVNNAVVVKKGGEPMVYETEDYTMVIGIDCVKIGFIFSNSKKGN